VAPNFIDRTIRISGVVGAVLFVFLTPYYPAAVTWGFLIGVALSGLNLWTLQSLFGSILRGSSKAKAASYLGIKFPLFYGLLLSVLYFISISHEAFFVGFVLPFVVIVLKTVGQVALEKSASSPLRMER